MGRIITEEIVKEAVKRQLAPQWRVVSEKELHEKGCDLVFKDVYNKHEARRFFVECKGKSYSKSARSIKDTNVLFCLGQLVSRMSVIAKHAYLYGLALPQDSAEIALRRIPWQAARHLCLHIFSVDDDGKVTQFSPKDFKGRQIAALLVKRTQRGLLATRASQGR